MHHRSGALDEFDVSILGLAAPLALEVRATAMCGLVPSDRDIAELVRRATQTPIQGAPGIPARVVAESDEFIPLLRSALAGVAIQRRARASEVALMPTLVEAAETIDEILRDPSLVLSDEEAKVFETVLAILDEETEEFVELLESEDELEDDATFDPPQSAASPRAMQDAERAAPKEHAALHRSLLDAAASAFESVLRLARPKVDAVMEEAAAGSLNPQHAVVYVALAAEHAGTNAVGFARKTSGSAASAAKRKALAMLGDARASFFRIRATDPENGLLTLEDVFAGDVLQVRDYGAARGLEPALYVFAILVPHDGVHLCVVAHAQPLRSSEAMAAITEGRKVLGHKGDVAVDRLRAPSTLRALFGIWAAHTQADEARDFLPQLTNHDGDPVLLTTDHFGFDAKDHDAIVDLLARGPDADREQEGDVTLIRWTRTPASQRSVENVLWASLRVGPTSVRVETNSVRRADDARTRVERLAGKMLRHRVREHTDPMSPEARSTAPKRPQKSVDARTEAQAVLAFKAQHYGSWPDVPVPALDGKTPRAAAKSAKLRPRLVRLLDDMTANEARAPAAHRFDFAALRRELGV